ncbi:MAG: B12-binding domain-containing radical SAM protein [Deltaproteobacteria bacterium]|nr:B12-binding domain-containing radical SAM protein [Deltaproteobacteria bacterium]MBI2500097.1 B12-binding domain-containing radical SAM protein [Deltaproteobacteria bacterium]
MMSDCLLIYPNPSEDATVRGPALSIFYPGAHAENNGLTIDYYDQRMDSPEKLKTCLENTMMVGISSMTGNQLRQTVNLLEMIKRDYPSLPIVMGGVHPSMQPLETMKNQHVDFAVIGEGEETLTELIKAVKNGQAYDKILGLIWRKEGQVIRNADRPQLRMANLPFPVTEKSKPYYQLASKYNELFYIHSRGCPYKCRFCYNLEFNDAKWRLMPADKMEREIGMLNEICGGINYLFLNDDYLGSNPAVIKRVSSVMKKYNIRWGTCLRASDIREDSLPLFVEGGLDRALFGLETGSERLLNGIIGKGLVQGLEDIRRCVTLLSKTNIFPTYSFMCNVPTETRDDIKKTLSMMDWIHKTDSKARLGLYVYTPYPGTPMFNDALEQGFTMPESLEQWGEMSLHNAHFSKRAESLYYLAGLVFRRDVSRQKFPGILRLMILPFEWSASIRWKLRFWSFYEFEKRCVMWLFKFGTSFRFRRQKQLAAEKAKEPAFLMHLGDSEKEDQEILDSLEGVCQPESPREVKRSLYANATSVG